MRYILYPFSTIGKLFFRQNGSNFVCSASVIGRRTIATAGHCLHSGSGGQNGWSSNILFCPSYNIQNGVNPLQGCWSWSSTTVSGSWFNSANTDRDYGCIVSSATGTVHPTQIGNVVGWTGRAWNWPSRQAIHSFGYPSASPFPGNEIIVATSTEWYEVDTRGGDGQVAKYIGNDMGKGSSGGPWWMSVAHPTREYADTDGSNVTDPFQNAGGPYINGVNSHSRCNAAGCPSGSVFSQEMGSPQFKNTTADIDESEDVFAICLSAQAQSVGKMPTSPTSPSVKAPTNAFSPSVQHSATSQGPVNRPNKAGGSQARK